MRLQLLHGGHARRITHGRVFEIGKLHRLSVTQRVDAGVMLDADGKATASIVICRLTPMKTASGTPGRSSMDRAQGNPCTSSRVG